MMTTSSAPRLWDVTLANGVWLGVFLASSSTAACEKAWEAFTRDPFSDGDERPMPKGINARLV